jgi:molybdate transport system ATP-binding protein
LRRRGEPGLGESVVVELLALGALLDRRVFGLSGGERQRVALGRALLSHPRLLLLDEPLASLDVAMKRQLLPMLRRVASSGGTPMVYVSHDIGEILQLTHELLVLDRGRNIGQGPLHRVVKDAQVFQLAAQTGLENVLRARIEEHLALSGLTRLCVIPEEGAQEPVGLLGPLLDRPVGAEVLVSVRPEDVAISLERISAISIQNQIPATVVRAGEVAGRGLLELQIGGPFLVEVSLRAMSALDLLPGRRAYCLFKAHEILYMYA